MIITKKHGIEAIILSIVSILMLTSADAFTTNGTQKNFDFAVTSGNNAELSSSNFKTFLVVGDIASTVNSSSFNAELGFIRTAHYLNGEACQINLECAGGFCCSNKCQSTSCPAEEKVAPSEAAAAEAGGGGGTFVPIGKDFSIDPSLIRALIKQGGTYQTTFAIKNTGTEDLSISIEAPDLEGILLLSDTQFSLSPDETKTIDVTIFAAENKKPDVYSGNIEIAADSLKKSLPVIVEIQAKKPLFDINVKVLPQYKNILKGENVIANITLTNVGDLKPVDVELYYALRDIEGNDLTFGIETLAVYDQVFRLKELELPSNISFGTYIFYGRVSYGIETAAAADVFYVTQQKPATCFDGIQNQGEAGIDCGGPCAKCKLKLINIFASIPFFIILGIIIIAFAVIAYIILRKALEEISEEKRRAKINRLYGFIDSALRKGYKVHYIRSILLSKGLSEEFVDKVIDKVTSEKLDAFRKIRSASQLGQTLSIKTVQLPKKLHDEVINYITKALNLGYPVREIEDSLSKAGWPEAEIKKHISEVLRHRLR